MDKYGIHTTRWPIKTPSLFEKGGGGTFSNFSPQNKGIEEAM